MKLVVSSVLSLNTLALTWTRLLWALPIPAGWLHRRSTRYQEENQGRTWDSPRGLLSKTLNLAAWASGGQSAQCLLQACPATSWFSCALGPLPPLPCSPCLTFHVS